MKNNKVWYITGASKGMGLALTKQLLLQGEKVAATSRNIRELINAVWNDTNFLPLAVDLSNDESVAASLLKTQETFGRIDVVVNNAGYGTGGALEELTSREINDSFDLNLFAVIRVIQQALPYLRAQRSGHIINISSIAGFAPGTGWSVYAAAKFAVTGLSETLYNDLKPLGIHVTAVLPGWFRTSFAKPESIAFSNNHIADYEYIREFHSKFSEMDGIQAGDPDKIAAVFTKLVRHENPPANLFIGSDAVQRAIGKIEKLNSDIEDWRPVSVSTDF